jgi:dephospho-CoA kinase
MMMYRLGLTGSIGMGKSTTAKMFADEGVPIWDADAVVHKLYAPNGAAVQLVAKLFPDVVDGNAVSRPKLRAMIGRDPNVLDRLQGAVHPLVAEDRAQFLRDCDADLVLLDIPLLFETGADTTCDGIVVVTVPPDIQRTRVLARGEMNEAEFEMILSRQMSDAEKRARATWVVDTQTMDGARAAVQDIITTIRQRIAHA